MTLNFIADIKAALYFELRSTVGLSANLFYFENNDINI